MTTRMLVDAFHREETRVVIAEDGNLLEFDVDTSAKKQTKGNIYLAKVTRIEPSLQAAFIEYGANRQGFLPFGEIHPDYYQIPTADREALLREQAEEHREQEEMEDEQEARQDAATESAEAGEVAEVSEPAEGQHAEGEQAEAAAAAGVEDLGSDVPFEQPARRPRSRRYKIQEVVKKNQLVLIQVIKEERGNKGASVTTYISLPGRYCVLMPNTNKGGGVSRKVGNNEERKRLKEVLGELDMKDGMSLILRTNAIGRTKTDVSRDYNYLTKLWNQVREDALHSVAPALVYEEANVIKRAIRDLYNDDMEEIVVSGKEGYKLAKDFMKMLLPTHVKNVKEHEDKSPIFNYFGIETQLAGMYDTVVTMPSGGYIVINQTEALISVDVNSGRSTGERNVEDTATRTNIEAAKEIARQLRLRDLAGLIVIDFIDMLNFRHRRQVEHALKDALRQDRAKIQVGRISPFGLLEMSRQRLRPSLVEMNMIECPSCKGAATIRSPESAMVQLVRAIENEIAQSEVAVKRIVVKATKTLSLDFLNQKRRRINELEEEYKFELVVQTEHMAPAAFKLEVLSEDGKTKNVSSDDREGRLPQSRDGGRGGKSRGRDRKRSTGPRKEERPRFDKRKSEDAAPVEGEQQSAEVPSNVEEMPAYVDDYMNAPDAVDNKDEKRDRNGRNRSRKRGGRNRNRNRGSQFIEGHPANAEREGQVVEPVVTGSGESDVVEIRKPLAQTQSEPEFQGAEGGADNNNDNGVDENGNPRKGWWRKIIE